MKKDELLKALAEIPLCQGYPNIKCTPNCACKIATAVVEQLKEPALDMNIKFTERYYVPPVYERPINYGTWQEVPEPIEVRNSSPFAWFLVLLLTMLLALTWANWPSLPTPQTIKTSQPAHNSIGLTELPAIHLTAWEPAPAPRLLRKQTSPRPHDQNIDNLPCRSSTTWRICQWTH